MRDIHIHIALTIGGSNISFRFQIPTHALLRLSRGERQKAEFNVKLEKKIFHFLLLLCMFAMKLTIFFYASESRLIKKSKVLSSCRRCRMSTKHCDVV